MRRLDMLRADHDIVHRLGDRFLEWATHALICTDRACQRCDEALYERPTRVPAEALP